MRWKSGRSLARTGGVVFVSALMGVATGCGEGGGIPLEVDREPAAKAPEERSPMTSTCRRLAIEPEPGWVGAGGVAWDLEEKGLVLIDVLASRTVHLTLRERIAESTVLFEDPPRAITVSVDRVVEEGVGSHLFGGAGAWEFVRRDGAGEELERFELFERAREAGLQVFAPYGWKVAGSSVLLLGKEMERRARDAGACACDREEEWSETGRKGLFRWPLEEPAELERPKLLFELPEGGGTLRGVYNTPDGFIAAVGGRAAFLSMEQKPRVLVERAGEMVELPRASAALPACPLCGELAWERLDEYGETLRRIAAPTMPRGLMGWGQKLLVLARGEGVWSVYRIDPEEDRVLVVVRESDRARRSRPSSRLRSSRKRTSRSARERFRSG